MITFGSASRFRSITIRQACCRPLWSFTSLMSRIRSFFTADAMLSTMFLRITL